MSTQTNAMRVKLGLTGVEKTSARYTAAQDRAEFPRPAFVAIGDDFLRIARSEFDSAGAYTGKAWAALADSTIARKRRQGLDSRVLVATGVLRSSLEAQGGDHVQEMTRNRLELGSNVPYLQYHQGRGRRNMPPRPLSIPHRDRQRWIETLRVYVLEGHV